MYLPGRLPNTLQGYTVSNEILENKTLTLDKIF